MNSHQLPSTEHHRGNKAYPRGMKHVCEQVNPASIALMHLLHPLQLQMRACLPRGFADIHVFVVIDPVHWDVMYH